MKAHERKWIKMSNSRDWHIIRGGYVHCEIDIRRDVRGRLPTVEDSLPIYSKNAEPRCLACLEIEKQKRRA